MYLFCVIKENKADLCDPVDSDFEYNGFGIRSESKTAEDAVCAA